MDLKVSRILHAGYVFECGETRIVFDPIFENPFSRNCFAFPDVRFDVDKIRETKFAAVFISHFHDDHCSFESLNLLDRQTPLYMFCVFEEMFSMLRELGFNHVHSLGLDATIQVGPFAVTPRRALDADVDSLFQIEAAGVKVLNVVDSWIDEQTLGLLASEAPWDLVLWPFQTMREIEVIAPSRASRAPVEVPPEWGPQLLALRPRAVVPSSCQFRFESWSWTNVAFFPLTYQHFQDMVSEILPKTHVLRLNPSESITLKRNAREISGPLEWVQPVGAQNLDYLYDPPVKAPPTSDIARHFEPLTGKETARVLSYCREGLLEKYRSLEPPLDPYFAKPRRWRLSLFDHAGQGVHFHYRLDGNKIERSLDASAEVAWATEVPISKMFAALELGESLTSMFLRINDEVFAPEVEDEIQGADIIEDPLIRCLFTGVFGAYQRAQLKRLRFEDPE